MAAFVTANCWTSGVATHKTKDGRILCTGIGCIGCFPNTFNSKAKECGVCDIDVNGQSFKTFLNEDHNEQKVAERLRRENRAKIKKAATKTPQIQKDDKGVQKSFEISFDDRPADCISKENSLEFFAQSCSSTSSSFETKDELARSEFSPSARFQSLNESKTEIILSSNNNFSNFVTTGGDELQNGHPLAITTVLNEDHNEQEVAKRSRTKLRAKTTKTTTRTPKTQKGYKGTQKSPEINGNKRVIDSLSTKNVSEFSAHSSFTTSTASSLEIETKPKDELEVPVDASTRSQSLNKSKPEINTFSNNHFSEFVTALGEDGSERDVNLNHKRAIKSLSSSVQKWIGVSQPGISNSESQESHSLYLSNCTCKNPRENKSGLTQSTDSKDSHRTAPVRRKKLATSDKIFGEIHDNIYFVQRDNKALNMNPDCSFEKENAVRLFFAIEYFHTARVIPNFKVLEVVEALSRVVGPRDIKYVQRKDNKWHMVLRTKKFLEILQRSGIRIRGRTYDLIEDDNKYFGIDD